MKLRKILEAIQKPSGDPSDNGEVQPAKKSSSDAAEKAHALKLVSKPYGNWADPSSGETVAKTIDNNLVKVDKSKGAEEKPDAAPGVPKLGNLKPQADASQQAARPAHSIDAMERQAVEQGVEFAFDDLNIDVRDASPEDVELMTKLVQKTPEESDGRYDSKRAARDFQRVKQSQTQQSNQMPKLGDLKPKQTLRQQAQSEFPDQFTATDAEKNAEMRQKLQGTGKTVDDKGIVQQDGPDPEWEKWRSQQGKQQQQRLADLDRISHKDIYQKYDGYSEERFPNDWGKNVLAARDLTDYELEPDEDAMFQQLFDKVYDGDSSPETLQQLRQLKAKVDQGWQDAQEPIPDHDPEEGGSHNPNEDDYKHFGPDESINLRGQMIRFRIQ
jgi:hypothetical protein